MVPFVFLCFLLVLLLQLTSSKSYEIKYVLLCLLSKLNFIYRQISLPCICMKITHDGMSRAGKKAIWPTRQGVKTKERKKKEQGVATLPLYIKTSSQMFSCPALLYSINKYLIQNVHIPWVKTYDVDIASLTYKASP